MTSQIRLEFNNLKLRLRSGIFKCIFLLLNSSVFVGDVWGFLNEGVKKTYLINGINDASYKVPFFCLHIRNLRL